MWKRQNPKIRLSQRLMLYLPWDQDVTKQINQAFTNDRIHIHLKHNCRPFVEGKDTYLNTILPATTSNIYTLIHFSKSTRICTFFFDNVSTHDSHPLQHGTFSNLSNGMGFRMSTIRISTCILLSLNSKLILDQSRGTRNCKMFLVSCHYH